MQLLTRLFGVTESDKDRDLAAEKAWIDEILRSSLEMQAGAAARQHRSLCRGTHAKGVLARAEFEILDVAAGRDPALAARLQRGIFKTPGVYPAIVRFGNSDPHVNSDFKPDVRSLSFAVDLTRGGTAAGPDGVARQDFSMQNATTLPINDARAFRATMKVLTAPNPAAGLWPLAFGDKLRVMRTLTLAAVQEYQKVRPYQQLRYWSNVPYRHGPSDVVKQSLTPSPANPFRALDRGNPNALQDELARHLDDDARMSSFDFGLQFLDIDAMTYWGERRDADFWIENASVGWKEAQAPFHNVATLTLLPKSGLSEAESEAAYIDVTDNTNADSTPIGSINRARCPAEIASRKARRASRAPD